MKLTILGSGTSHGVPVIGCDCPVCKSSDSKDKRLRSSALLSLENGKNYLIDVGPDFRQQALRIGLKKLEAVFLTHAHADHVHGIDDLRIFSHKNSQAMNKDEFVLHKYPETSGKGLAMYMNGSTEKMVRENFRYIFMDHGTGGGTPKLNIINIDKNNAKNPIILGNLSVVPVPMIHGEMHTTGWVFSEVSSKDGKKHSIAYLTDCNYIPDGSLEQVELASEGGILDHLVIDALRERPHSSHNSFEQALAYAQSIGARHSWLIHMSHDFFHTGIQEFIDKRLKNYKSLQAVVANGGSVSPSYDGLELFCE